MDKEIAVEPAKPFTSPPFNPASAGLNRVERLKKHFSADVTTAHADILLLTCCLISGLVDSTVYNAYGTFVSMQTGNTIFLGLGGSTSYSTSKPFGWAKSLLSIATFCFGCFIFSFTSRALSPLRRSTLTASFLLQTFLILATATIIETGVADGSLSNIPDDIDWRQLLPIALLSFQSAGQIVTSRALGLAEVPTVVLTSMLHDVASDRELLVPVKENIKRNRRLVAFFAILVGAVAGGFISENTDRMQDPLWLAGGIKLLITGAWVIWPKKEANVV